MAKTATKEDLVREFDFGLRVNKLSPPQHELQFHPERKWRFDRAWPNAKVAVEVHGGVWSGGRHVQGQGFTNDREKMNEAQLMGWTVLEVVPEQIRSGKAYQWIGKALQGGLK